MLSDDLIISLAHILVVCLVSNEKKNINGRNIFGGELSYVQEEDRNISFEVVMLRTFIGFHSLNVQSNSKC